MKYCITAYKEVNPGDIISIRRWKISKEDPIYLIGIYHDEYENEWADECVSFKYFKNGKFILIPDATELYHKYMLCYQKYVSKRELKLL